MTLTQKKAEAAIRKPWRGGGVIAKGTEQKRERECEPREEKVR